MSNSPIIGDEPTEAPPVDEPSEDQPSESPDDE